MSSEEQLRGNGSPAVDSLASDEDVSMEDDVLQQQEKGEEISQPLFESTTLNVSVENAKVIGGKSNYQRRAKPPFSYIALIAMAIQESQTQRLTLAEINDYLMKKFPFFRGDYTGWRNSVRHNLSLNECFQKVLRDPNRPWGKDNYWMLNESSDYTFADGVFRRRRKRLHKKSKGKTGDRRASPLPVAKAYTATTVMNNFNPEHKHVCPRSRQSSFLIDDLLAREKSTSQAENATAEEVSSSRKSATVHAAHNNSPSSNDRSQCEQDDRSLSPPARQSKLSKEASSSPADHLPIRGQQRQRQTHSSSPPIIRSSSSISSRQATVSSSTGTLKWKCRDNVNNTNTSPNRQHDGSEKSWGKYEVEKIIAKPQFVRFEAAGLPAYGSPFCWPAGPYLSPLHQQAVMAAQQFTRAYPFSANTFSANLYPFLSPQQALQMSSSGIHSNDLSQQLSLAAFSHFPLKPFS